MPKPDGMPDAAVPQAARDRGKPPSARQPASDRGSADMTDRALGVLLRRGWRRRCPACDRVPMPRGYPTVQDTGPSCGEALPHHRAGDGPVDLTILVVGHVMALLFLFVFITLRPDLWAMLAVCTVGVLTLCLLPRMKGAMVALQWSRRLHGFGSPGSG